jgi:hypothetical protein
MVNKPILKGISNYLPSPIMQFLHHIRKSPELPPTLSNLTIHNPETSGQLTVRHVTPWGPLRGKVGAIRKTFGDIMKLMP